MGTTANPRGPARYAEQGAGTGPGVGTGFCRGIAGIRGLRHVPEQAGCGRHAAAIHMDCHRPYLIDAAKVDIGDGRLISHHNTTIGLCCGVRVGRTMGLPPAGPLNIFTHNR